MLQPAYRARTQLGTLLLVVVVGLGLFALQDRGWEWVGEWLWTVDRLGIVPFLAGPVIAAVAAVDAAWRLRSSAGALVTTAPRRQRDWLGAWLWVAGSAALGYLLTAGIALTATLIDGAVGAPPVSGLVTQVVVLGFYAALGMLAGILLPLGIAPIAVFGASVALNLGLIDGPGGFGFLTVGGATGSPAGSDYSATFLGAQVAVLTILTVLALVAVTTAQHQVRRLAPTGVVATLVAVAIGVGAYHIGPERRFVDDPVPVSAMTCVSGTGRPLICVLPEHQRVLDQVVAIFDAVYDSAVRRGLPREALFDQLIEQVGDDPAAEPGGFVLPDRSFRRPIQVSSEDLIRTVTIPWHCPGLPNDAVPSDYLDRAEALSGWLSADPSSGIDAEEAASILGDLKRCDLI